jgi:F-type H+-transporting ATPase subunit alpha
LPVERQVLSIYAGTNGFVDEVPAKDVRRFESELFAYAEARHAATLKELSDKKAIDDALKAKIEALLKEFKAQFK